MGLLGGHCFYNKRMDVLCKRWEFKGCKQIFTRDENLIRDLKKERCTGGKTKIICSDGKSRHILNSSENVLYDGNTNLVLPPVIGLRHRPWKQVNTFITKCMDIVENAW